MLFFESIRMAFASIAAHRLRSALTLFSMAIGVFAIVGVGAAIEVLNNTLNTQLASIGSDDFVIAQKVEQEGGMRVRSYRPITIREAMTFRERMPDGPEIGLQMSLGQSLVSFGDAETDRNIRVVGADQNYLLFDDRSLTAGRNVNVTDVEQAEDVVMLGSDVADRLRIRPAQVGSEVDIDGHRFRVAGILEGKGSTMGMSQDNLVVIPITVGRKYFPDVDRRSVSIMVRTKEGNMEDRADQAVGLMRGIRRLSVYSPDDFDLTTHGDIEETIGGFTRYITFFGAFCGIVALLAAGIGVMNIMLVSVRERTREIGLRKAVGATRSTLVSQFLIEALTLCQLGAIIGVLGGLLAGVLLGVALDAPAPAPLQSALLSIGVCTGIGVLFGSYPAWKAASLDPIESLRYE